MPTLRPSFLDDKSPSPVPAANDAPDGALGRLLALINDDLVNEVMINRHDRVFVEKNGRMQDAGIAFASTQAVDAAADAILAMCGRDKDDPSLISEAIMPDGSRLSVIRQPIAVESTIISIRKFSKNLITLDGMVQQNIISAPLAAFLKAAVRERCNILVAGTTSAGKTTLLNALSVYISESERIVTIEDTPELKIQHRNVVRLEASTGYAAPRDADVTMRHLLKSSLRLRPDRIIIGEVRGAEAFDLLQAINTGHAGSMATLHANGPRDAFSRLEHMINMANMNLPLKGVREQIALAVDLVIQMERDADGKRFISHVTELVGLEGDRFISQDLFQTEGRHGSPHTPSNVTSRNHKIQRVIQQTKLS